MPVTPFEFALRVYWEDTDAGGVVFYVNHLKFFERARTEWLRHLGFSQERWRAEAQCGFVVTDTSVRYLQPARLDDVVHVTTAVTEAGRASLLLAQQARRGDHDGALLAQGTVRIGFVDVGTFRPRRIPNDLLRSLA